MRHLALVVAFAASLAPTACATYQDDLKRAEHAYDASEDERALATFRMLEVDVSRLSVGDRAHYAYLRGMTDLRMGYKAEARHWLAVAAAMDQATPGALPPDWSAKLNEAVKELNEQVFTAGIEALTNNPAARARATDDEQPPPAPATPAPEPDAK